MLATRGTPTVRLNRRLERKPSGCLEWTGCTSKKGYGRIRVEGKVILTHRLAWTLTHGPIPPGVKVLHRCDNPPCCDADVCLFLGTDADNSADMVAKGRCKAGQFNSEKTHCPSNHEYTKENTLVRANGYRECRECRRIYMARYQRKGIR